jgi:NAD(P)-dependent dehydrogenase (short-subunit alcohol dehydrogenase family)
MGTTICTRAVTREDEMGLVSGKYALVTGGGTGIGFGVAQRLLDEGAARVLIVGRRKQVLEQATNRLKEAVSDAPVDFMVCDITDEEQVKAAVTASSDENGQLDICVANAGSGFPSPILHSSAEGWRFCCELNIIGTAMCVKHAANAMKRRGGSIITISSVAGAKVQKWMAAYSTTKAALEMLTKCAAVELAPFNIRVNCIEPGYVETESTIDHLSDGLKAQCLDHTLLRRPGDVLEQGDAVLYFASDMGKWVTGQILGVCGGMSVSVGEDFEDLNRQLYGDDVMNACQAKTD